MTKYCEESSVRQSNPEGVTFVLKVTPSVDFYNDNLTSNLR